MVKIKIREPIWYNKSVGIADDKIVDDLEVEILFKDRTGNRVFPGRYQITAFKARLHPVAYHRGGHAIRQIPIANMLRVE